MNSTNANASTTPSRIHRIGAIGILSLSILAGTAGIANAASLTPKPVNEGNPTCGDFDHGWTQLKVGPPGNGTFGDGTLTVTITNFQNSNGGTLGSFDWSANIGVDAVFVKAGTDKHNLYVYDPESLGDTDLVPQDGQGNGISHINFCYDAGSDPTPTPEEPTPTPEEPTPTGSELPADSDGRIPSGEVAGVVGTPQPTPPATDSLSVDAGERSAVPAMIVIGGLLAAVALFSIRRPAGSRG